MVKEDFRVLYNFCVVKYLLFYDISFKEINSKLYFDGRRRGDN